MKNPHYPWQVATGVTLDHCLHTLDTSFGAVPSSENLAG